MEPGRGFQLGERDRKSCYEEKVGKSVPEEKTRTGGERGRALLIGPGRRDQGRWMGYRKRRMQGLRRKGIYPFGGRGDLKGEGSYNQLEHGWGGKKNQARIGIVGQGSDGGLV